MLKVLLTTILLLTVINPRMSADAQVAVPVHCPFGYVHNGGFCVQGIHRIPFADFMRGGRYWGRPFPRHGTVIRPQPHHGGHPHRVH